MHIHLDDPARARDLADYLRASGCLVAESGLGTIEASPPPSSLATDEAERELESYVLLWRASTGVDAVTTGDFDAPAERLSLAQLF